jgi:cysteine desulfurase/selenocysteine lyase
MTPIGSLDVRKIRNDFPILHRTVHGRPLVYLDNAASSQKPAVVVAAVSGYFLTSHANVHRGAHQLSVEATDAYEAARAIVADFIGGRTRELVFTRGTTESINLVAASWGGSNLREGDEVLLTVMEHHSNLVPWQLIAERTGARLQFAGLTPDGRLDLADLAAKIGPRTRMVAVTHVSNTLGVVNPVAEITALAHEAGALCLIDGAQAAPHLDVDVAKIGCDFYAFSGHKMCGPTGIGALWGRRELLDDMPPWQGGGEMISEVRLDGSTWAAVPHKFEAGTPSVGDAVGLGAAVRYLQQVGLDEIHEHETRLTEYALDRLTELDGFDLFGPRTDRVGVISFRYGDIHAHDLATILDAHGIAIRAGHHCNQPLMDHLGVDATARASVYLYNTHEEIDALVEGLLAARTLFGGFA